MTARSSMHWFVPPSIDIRSESNEQRRDSRGVRARPPPALLLSPSAAAAIRVFTPVAADSTMAFSPRLHERASSIKKQASRFPFDAASAAAGAVAASPSASARTAPVTVSCLSPPFKLLRSPMHVPATPVAVMQLCAPLVSPCWQQQQLSPDQQSLRSLLLSPTCSVLRRRPAFVGHCRSSSASVAASDSVSATQLQSMIDACTLTADPSDAAAPQPLSLALSHLRYLDSLHLVFHSAAEITDALRELTLHSQQAVREIAALLQESACAATSAAETAAWRILLESGAGVDSAFFLRLLFSQRTSTAAPFFSPSTSHPPPSPSQRCSDLDLLVSLLQSFVKHYAQETREPLVSFLMQQRCEWNRPLQPQPLQQPQQQQTAELHNSAPVRMSDEEQPASAALPSGPLHRQQQSLPSARFNSPTALVHRLFMSLGPAHVDRLHGVIVALVAGGNPSLQHPPSQPQLIGELTPGFSSFAVDALRPNTQISGGIEVVALSWTQISAAAVQSCRSLAPSPWS